jgi:Domain of unknown function (DUF4293)
MIQRVQSIFLFLIGVLMTLMLFFPLWSKQNADETVQLTTLKLTYLRQAETVSEQTAVYVGILIFVSISLAFISLFSFKNRMMQIKLNLLNVIILVVITSVASYLSVVVGQALFAPEVKGSFNWTFYIPTVCVLLISLSNHFIRKDEKLVRSIDRLR